MNVEVSCRPRGTMYNAVLRAFRVKWGTSSATQHLMGQQQSQGFSLIRTFEKIHSYIFVHIRTDSYIFVLQKKAQSR